MIVKKAGYRYKVENWNAPGEQTIQFIDRQPINGTTELETVTEGTTTEEVLAVLIHRLEVLNKKVPCTQNESAINSLRLAQKAINDRAFDRMRRGVKHTYAK